MDNDTDYLSEQRHIKLSGRIDNSTQVNYRCSFIDPFDRNKDDNLISHIRWRINLMKSCELENIPIQPIEDSPKSPEIVIKSESESECSDSSSITDYSALPDSEFGTISFPWITPKYSNTEPTLSSPTYSDITVTSSLFNHHPNHHYAEPTDLSYSRLLYDIKELRMYESRAYPSEDNIKKIQSHQTKGLNHIKVAKNVPHKQQREIYNKYDNIHYTIHHTHKNTTTPSTTKTKTQKNQHTKKTSQLKGKSSTTTSNSNKNIKSTHTRVQIIPSMTPFQTNYSIVKKVSIADVITAGVPDTVNDDDEDYSYSDKSS